MYGSLGLADFVARLVVSDFHSPNEQAKCFWRQKFEKTSCILLFAFKLALVASFKVKYPKFHFEFKNKEATRRQQGLICKQTKEQ